MRLRRWAVPAHRTIIVHGEGKAAITIGGGGPTTKLREDIEVRLRPRGSAPPGLLVQRESNLSGESETMGLVMSLTKTMLARPPTMVTYLRC